MKKPDAIAMLEADHEKLAAGLARFVAFVNASDDALAREEWDALEAQLLAHLDAEEMFLLPGFERERPTDAAAIREEHARIRKLLGEIGIAIELHVLRIEKADELRELLVSHVQGESASLYRWAQGSADHDSLGVLLRRLGPPTTKDRAALALADLLRACEDGEKGYRAAGSGMADPGYQQMFAHYAAERARFAKTLEGAARELGGPSPQDGSGLGSLHRGWLSAVSTIAKGNPRAVLRECQRGEDAALKAYRAALRAELPPGVREDVQQQYEAIQKARAEVAALVDADGP